MHKLRYRTVILPDAIPVEGALAEEIARFAAAGGEVVLLSLSTFCDLQFAG